SLDHLDAERLLAVQGIASQHAALPVDLLNRVGRHCQFSFVLLGIDHQLGQHTAKVVAKGADAGDGMVSSSAVAHAATLSFAIEPHSLTAARSDFSRPSRVDHALDCRSYIGVV